MKKKVLLISVIIFVIVICNIVGMFIFIRQRDSTLSLIQNNVVIEYGETYNPTIKNLIDLGNFDFVDETKTNIESNIENEVIEKTISTETSTNSTTSNKTTNSNSTTSKNNSTTSTSNNPQTNANTSTSSSNSSTNTQNSVSTENEVQQTITRCTTTNNHGMDVGNSGKWFTSKSEAVEYYNNQLTYWSNLCENNQIDINEYYANCPYGYEVWSCPYCGKWTINFYYR